MCIRNILLLGLGVKRVHVRSAQHVFCDLIYYKLSFEFNYLLLGTIFFSQTSQTLKCSTGQ